MPIYMRSHAGAWERENDISVTMNLIQGLIRDQITLILSRKRKSRRYYFHASTTCQSFTCFIDHDKPVRFCKRRDHSRSEFFTCHKRCAVEIAGDKSASPLFDFVVASHSCLDCTEVLLFCSAECEDDTLGKEFKIKRGGKGIAGKIEYESVAYAPETGRFARFYLYFVKDVLIGKRLKRLFREVCFPYADTA